MILHWYFSYLSWLRMKCQLMSYNYSLSLLISSPPKKFWSRKFQYSIGNFSQKSLLWELQTLGMPLWHSSCSREPLQISAAFPGLAEQLQSSLPYFVLQNWAWWWQNRLAPGWLTVKPHFRTGYRRIDSTDTIWAPSPLHQRLSNPHQY